MRISILIILIMVIISSLAAQEMAPWYDIHHSAVTESGNVVLRLNAMTNPGDGMQCYYSSNDAAWTELNMNGTGDSGYESLLPYSYGQNLQYRFRTASSYDNEVYAFLNPTLLSTNTFPPALNKMAWIGADSVGDSVAVYNPSLDFTNTYFGCTDTKFFSAVQSSNGLYPTFYNLQSFNAYLVLLVNPETTATDNTAYAMVYTFSIPGVISSGLYKVGIDESENPTFERIGNIQAQTSGGKLYMACDISDLIASPDFGAWPNESHMLASVALSMNISIPTGSVTPTFGFGDYSVMGTMLFDFYNIDETANVLPVISQTSFSNTGAGQDLSFEYSDANQDFPLVSELHLDNGEILPLTPNNWDFSGSVSYSLFIPSTHVYNSAEIRISDNGMDFVTHTVYLSANDDATAVPAAISCTLPNPISMRGNAIPIRMSGMQKAPIQVSVYNLKGQKMGNIFDFYANSSDQVLNWNGTVNGKTLTSGVYYLRVTQLNNSFNKRITVIR